MAPALQKAPLKLRPRRAAPEAESSWQDDLPAIVLGVLCAVLPCIVKVGLRDLFQLPKTFALTYGAAWLLAIVAGMALLGRPISWPKTPLKWPLVLLAAAIGIGVGMAPVQTGGTLSIFAKMDAYRWGSALVIFAVSLSTLRRPRHLLYVLIGMMVGGLAVALFGIGQHHNITALLPRDASKWRAINPPGSSFGNRNMAAQLIVSVMPATYVIMAIGLRWWRRGLTQRALMAAGGGTALLFTMLYYLRLSVTRSAWGGAILGLLVAAVVIGVGLLRARGGEVSEESAASLPAPEAPKRPAWPLLVGLLVAGFAFLTIATSVMEKSGYRAKYDNFHGDRKRQKSVIELFSSVGDFEQSHWDLRFMMWESTWEAIKDNPLGGGAGNWRVLFPQYVVRRSGNEHFTIAKQPVRAHQDFLQVWSEFGTQGLFALLALLTIALWMGTEVVRWQQRRAVADRDDVAWLVYGNLAAIAGITAICGDGLLSFPFQLPAPTFFFFVHLAFIGSSWAIIRSVVQPTPAADGAVAAPRAQPVQPGIKIALAVAGIAAVSFVHYENPRLLEAEKSFTNGRRLQRRNPTSGLTEIRKAVALNPDDFQNHFIEALCHNSLRNKPKAIAAIERSLNLYPNLLNAWVNLALFARKAGDEAKMLYAVDTALKLKPDETYVLDLKADHLASRGRHGEVVKLYEPWVDGLNKDWRKNNRRYLLKYAKALEATRQWAKLGATYEQMIRYQAYKPKLNAKARKKKEKRYLANRLKYWTKAAAAYNKAGKYADEVRLLELAAGYVRHSNGNIKRRYAVALARTQDWDRALHAAGVTLDVDSSQKTALLQTFGAYRQQATAAKSSQGESAGDWPKLAKAGVEKLDRIIAMVRKW